MGYTPENNPYIPGDPYSYDLKWLVEKVKQCVADYASLTQRFDDLENDFNVISGDFTDLYNYVHDYFDNLDLSQEVSDKIDEMIADGTLLQLFTDKVVYYVTPEMFGAKGDGVTDDTQAFQDAASTNKTIALSAKTYLISDAINLNADMIGNGMHSIIHFTHNGNCIVIGAGDLNIKNLRIVGNGGANTNGIEFSQLSGHCNFENLKIIYVNNCIHTSYALYSCSFSNLWLDRFQHDGLCLEGNGSTGCVFSNIYCTAWDDYSTRTMGTARYGIYMSGYCECVLQQINVEHGLYQGGVCFNNCENIEVNTLHFEGVVPTNNYNGMLNILASSAHVTDIVIVYSGSSSEGYSNTPVTLTNANMIAILNNSQLIVDNLYMRDNSWNDNTYKFIAYSNGNANQSLTINRFFDRENLVSQTSGFVNTKRKPCVMRIGESIFGSITPSGVNRQVNSTFTIATSGYDDMFYEGDSFTNKSPSGSGFIKYIVISRGNPAKPDTGAKCIGTQYQGYIDYDQNILNQGDTIEISGTRYVCTGTSYSSGNPNYPRRINVTPNVAANYSDEAILKAAPLVASLDYTAV